MILQRLSNAYQRLPVISHLRKIALALLDMKAQLNHLNTLEQIRLLDFDLRDDPRFQDPKRLLRHQAQICSQNGEDGIIHEIFRRIGTTSKVFVEIGVGDGRENNTAFLLSLGWTGYWFDGGDAFLGALRGRPDLAGDCLRHRIGFVTKENVAELFEGLRVPREFDLLSVDIDQNTYHVWEGLEAYRPRVVVVEYNAALPPDVDWKVNYEPTRCWDGTQNYSASLKAYDNLGRRFGYSLVGCDSTGLNAFLVRSDLVGDRFCEPFTAENHHEPLRYAMTYYRRSHPPAILDRPLEH